MTIKNVHRADGSVEPGQRKRNFGRVRRRRVRERRVRQRCFFFLTIHPNHQGILQNLGNEVIGKLSMALKTRHEQQIEPQFPRFSRTFAERGPICGLGHLCGTQVVRVKKKWKKQNQMKNPFPKKIQYFFPRHRKIKKNEKSTTI